MFRWPCVHHTRDTLQWLLHLAVPIDNVTHQHTIQLSRRRANGRHRCSEQGLSRTRHTPTPTHAQSSAPCTAQSTRARNQQYHCMHHISQKVKQLPLRPPPPPPHTHTRHAGFGATPAHLFLVDIIFVIHGVGDSLVG